VRGHLARGVVRCLPSAVLVVTAVVAPVSRPTAAPVGTDPRRAVEDFVGRFGEVDITDLVITQKLTLYHPDGRHPQSTGEQRLFVKLPQRQRLEQTIDGQKEIRLAVADRTWVWRDGKVTGATSLERQRSQLIAPSKRSVDDLLADWKARGVRTDVSHVTRYRRRTVTVIGAAPDDRQVPAVWLDPEYGVVRVVTREKVGPREGVLDLTLSEHRPLRDGVFYPFREELFADSRLLLVISVKSVDVNRGLSEELFDPDALRRLR
jgi:hypothetical protein